MPRARNPRDRDGAERVEVVTTRRGGNDFQQLLIDDEPVPYGRLFDGSYFLMDNAYEWGEDLRELGERQARYLAQAARRRPRRR